MALKDVLKKVGGVVAGVASTLVKGIPLVGNAVSGVLSNVSTKLLASPTPQKESAAALQRNLPPGPSTPIKASAIALQAGVAPAASTPIKQAAADLNGQRPYYTSGGIQLSSPMESLVKISEPVKTSKEISEGTSGSEKKLSTNAIVAIVGGIILFFVIIFGLFSKRRR